MFFKDNALDIWLHTYFNILKMNHSSLLFSSKKILRNDIPNSLFYVTKLFLFSRRMPSIYLSC